jgi:hypothetical protein
MNLCAALPKVVKVSWGQNRSTELLTILPKKILQLLSKIITNLCSWMLGSTRVILRQRVSQLFVFFPGENFRKIPVSQQPLKPETK